MQPRDLTIDQVINRQKKDNFGNMTFDVKFLEDDRMVYMAAKTEPKKGWTKYGYIEDGQYGPKFKSVKKEDAGDGSFTGFAKKTYNSPTPQGKKSDDERSQDIRWGLCIKEANLYVTKNREDLASDQWAIEVNEYANALYRLSEGPDKTDAERVAEKVGGDVLPTDDDMNKPLDARDLPF